MTYTRNLEAALDAVTEALEGAPTAHERAETQHVIDLLMNMIASQEAIERRAEWEAR